MPNLNLDGAIAGYLTAMCSIRIGANTRLRIAVVRVVEEGGIIDILAQRFGGYVGTVNPQGYRPQRSWYVENQNAKPVLRLLAASPIPGARVEIAKIALEYLEWYQRNRKRGKPWTPEERRTVGEYQERIREKQSRRKRNA